jgi:ATPases of the AAA+ class
MEVKMRRKKNHTEIKTSGMDLKKKQGFIEKKKLQYLCNAFSYASPHNAPDRLIELGLKYLTRSQQQGIIKECMAYLEKVCKSRDEITSMKSRYKNDTVEETVTFMFRQDLLKKRIARSILAFLEELRTRKNTVVNDIAEKKLGEIKSIFSLNDVEKELLLLFHLINNDCMVDQLRDNLSELMQVRTYKGISAQNKWPFAILTGCKKLDIDKALSSSSTLLRSCLIDDELNIPSEITSFIEGGNDNPISNKYFSGFTGEAVPIDYHTIDKKHIGMVKTLFENKPRDKGINILLYGEPGTGKTEFARSLGKAFGLSIYEIHNIDAESDRERGLNFFRYRALLACQRMVDTNKSLIIVDESDTLLNSVSSFFSFTPVAEKGQINKVLDDSNALIVWITNRYDGIDESTKRRFDYSIGFEKLTFGQRRTIWQHSLSKHKLTGCISEKEIDSLAADFEISAGGIDVALRNAARIYARSKSSQGILDVIHGLMKAHLTILDTDKIGLNVKKANAPDYSLDGLNIKGDVQGTISIIKKFNDYWTTTGENVEIRNMNLLLYGLPGTGKTEFAKHIARLMKRRLIVKRASDILSMWVGQTEKIIRQAFCEAERDKAVLFIDEADSLLGAREGASQSWEITQVNEMLTNMENFRGMLICATNFKRIVDSAAIRRFNIKLEFDYLKPEGAVTFYNLFMKNLVETPLSDRQAALVGNIPTLTPGDFKVVYQKYSFLDKNELFHDRIIDALREEIRAKNANAGKTMGFSGV